MSKTTTKVWIATACDADLGDAFRHLARTRGRSVSEELRGAMLDRLDAARRELEPPADPKR